MDYNNVATFHLAPGYTKFHAFCAEAEITEDYAITCEAANVISDDEDETDWRPASATPEEPPITLTTNSDRDTQALKQGPMTKILN